MPAYITSSSPVCIFLSPSFSSFLSISIPISLSPVSFFFSFLVCEAMYVHAARFSAVHSFRAFERDGDCPFHLSVTPKVRARAHFGRHFGPRWKIAPEMIHYLRAASRASYRCPRIVSSGSLIGDIAGTLAEVIPSATRARSTIDKCVYFCVYVQNLYDVLLLLMLFSAKGTKVNDEL